MYRGLATNELRVRFKLEDRSVFERKITLPFPMRDHRVFLKLLQLDIESHPPQAPVIAASVAAEPVKPRVLQNGLFIPLAPEPAKLELTVARIAKLVGPGNVGSPELLDTNRRGAFRIKRFGEVRKSTGVRVPANPDNQTCVLGLRVFRPPLPARVDAPKERPTRVIPLESGEKRGRKYTRQRVGGKVMWAAGPWRTSGDWWTEDEWARDEWDVLVEPEMLLLIYRDLRKGTWFIEGVYD
jgi:protein ImuB